MPWSKTRGAVAEEVVIEVVVFFAAGFVVVVAFFAFATVTFEEVVLPRDLEAVYSDHDMLVTFFEGVVAFVDDVLTWVVVLVVLRFLTVVAVEVVVGEVEEVVERTGGDVLLEEAAEVDGVTETVEGGGGARSGIHQVPSSSRV